MSDVCICRYPLLVRDNRGPEPVDFMSVPIGIFTDREFRLPRIERIVLNDTDGNPMNCIAVHWKELDHENISTYDVNNHLVIAGCDPSRMSMKDGMLVCNVKDIYTVFHPEEEWDSYHIVDIDSDSVLQ